MISTTNSHDSADFQLREALRRIPPDLRERSPREIVQGLRSLCEGVQAPQRAGAVPTGIEGLDAALPRAGLDRHGVHEWIGVAEAERPPGAGRRWSPPLAVLVQLARSAVAHLEAGRVVWIGAAAWPNPAALGVRAVEGRGSLLCRSLFVRAAHPVERLWAADLSLRSGAAAVVVADGSGLDLAATRRLQLAAEAGGTPCLLARPPWERPVLSAAATRWRVAFAPSEHGTRRWTVELLRCKGVQPSPHETRVWTLEHDDATGSLALAADVLDRPGQAEPGRAWRAG